MTRSLLLAAALLSLACPKPKPPPRALPAPQEDPAPSTPNRFDSLAWPEITTADKYAFADRVAPALFTAIEREKIPFAVVPLDDLRVPLEPFLREGLPAASPAPSVAAGETPEALAAAALLQGPDGEAWRALDAALLAQGKRSRVLSLQPPGAIALDGPRIMIAFDASLGMEWFSYLTCKALLRSSGALRQNLIGADPTLPYRWTPGEEELCLWSLLGTREHLRAEAGLGRAPQEDPSLLRLDAAARAGHVRGFVLVEFLLPRRGSLAGLDDDELRAAAKYLLAHALETNSLASR